MTRQPDNRCVQRLLPPSRHFLGQGVRHKLDLLVGVRAASAATASFAQLYRHKPVHVRVLQREHEAAGAAFTAWFLSWCFALDQLSEPQRETLFADSTWSGKQEGLWQLSGGVGARQSGLNPFVPDEGR